MKWWNFAIVVLFLGAAGGLIGCGPAPQAAPTAAGSEFGSEFQRKWSELVAKAQEEGELVMIMGPGGYRYSGPLREHFSRKFGIRVVATGGTGGEQVTRVSAERSAGRFTVDIAHLGVSSNVQLASVGMLAPIWPLIIHPDILDPEGWILPQPVYEDVQKEYILDRQADAPPNIVDIYYNTRRVSQAEIDSVQSWFDFLKPQWRGRIVTSLSPDVPGGGPAYGWMFLGRNFFERFIREMNVTHLPYASGREVMDGLASGKWDVVLFYGGGDVRGEVGALKELGLPVAELERTLKEGTIIDLQGGMGIFDRAPHPHAAQLWFNWLLSREGQTVENSITEEVGPRPSLRRDIPQGKVEDAAFNRLQNLGREQLRLASTSDPAYVVAQREVNDFLKTIYRELALYGY